MSPAPRSEQAADNAFSSIGRSLPGAICETAEIRPGLIRLQMSAAASLRHRHFSCAGFDAVNEA
jgi:hypothetical protein